MPNERGTKGFQPQPLEERFWSKVQKAGDDECWHWTGGTDQRGYGQIFLDGRQHRASRVSWSLRYRVPFPDELHACHTCDNPNCVNPRHIWPGTASQNAKDAARKGGVTPPRYITPTPKHWAEGVCLRGHPTAVHGRTDTRGRFVCRECMKLYRAKYEQKARAAHAALAEDTP